MVRIFYIGHPDVNQIESENKIRKYYGDFIWERNNINTCDFVIIEGSNGCFSQLNYHYIEIAKLLGKKILTIDFEPITPVFEILDKSNDIYYCKIQLTLKQKLIKDLKKFNVIVTNNDVRLYNEEQKTVLLNYLYDFNDNLINGNIQIIKYCCKDDMFSISDFIKFVYARESNE